ncbi:MAG: B12-binding domain-containing radical SAM protein [Candidatus Omnitrophica bacterium]|nr:B12-binding domain-containing radical SAM protein [Candidatus Omnitrophota bacterium]
MKIGFVAWRFESLGLQYLSACLKQRGHSVRLYFDPSLFYDDHFFFSKRLHKVFDVRDRIVQEIVDEAPDLLCFSVLAGNYAWACQIAADVKRQKNIPIIFGGIHPTSVPDVVINKDFVDYVCVGEGEAPLAELVSALERKVSPQGIANIWFKENGKVISNPVRPLVQDLDSLPLPDKDLFYRECPHIVNSVYVTMASRGCYYSCAYCCNDVLAHLYPGCKGQVRVRSVDQLIKELKIAREKYNPRWIYFNDDIFPCTPLWLEEFCSRYKDEIGLPFGINSHVRLINQRYVSLIARAGGASVDMGIQSCDANVREKMLHRSMDNDQIEDAIKLLKSYRLYVYIDLMLGLSQEIDDGVDRTISSLRRWRPDGIATLFLSHFAETTLTKKLFADGRISEEKMKVIRDPLSGSLSFVAGGDVSSKVLMLNAAYYQFALFVPKGLLDFFRRCSVLKVMPQTVILRVFVHFFGFIRRFYVSAVEKRKRCFRFSIQKEALFYITYLKRWLLGCFFRAKVSG